MLSRRFVGALAAFAAIAVPCTEGLAQKKAPATKKAAAAEVAAEGPRGGRVITEFPVPEVPSTDPLAGLYVRTRTGQVFQARWPGLERGPRNAGTCPSCSDRGHETTTWREPVHAWSPPSALPGLNSTPQIPSGAFSFLPGDSCPAEI